MAIKAGQILHDVHGFVIDRIQTGGVSSLNIPEEKIYELGNYQTVATIRDIPDLTFEVESLDVSTEMEALIHGKDPTTEVSGAAYSFALAMPLDVVSPFKSGNGAFDIVKGVAIPNVTLESVAYRFGLRANATQTFTFKGDSIYYTPGTPVVDSFTLAGVGPYTFASTPVSSYTEAGVTQYALAVCLRNAATGAYKRLFRGAGADYLDNATTVTLNGSVSLTGYTDIQITYGTTAATDYLQSVHEGVSVKPAAIRGKDIDIYVGAEGATPGALTRWAGVQSFEATRRVALENDEEFGNYHYVASDYDVPEVSGNVVLKPLSPAELFAKIAQVANVATNVVAGTSTSIPLAMEARISDPTTSSVIKTIYVPDARFQVPAIQGRVQTKLTTTFNFTSDGGLMTVYKGTR